MFLKKRCFLLFVLPVFMVSCQQELQQPSYQYVLENPAGAGTRFPNLYEDADGNIYMSWLLNIEEDMSAVQYSVFDGRWTAPRTADISNDYFVNWADFPSVVGMGGDVVAGHWLRKVAGGPYAYNVNIAFPAAPRRWTDAVTPHSDGTPTEHGFVSMEPIDRETVLAVWLDGRETDGRDHSDYGNMNQAMTLRSAEVSKSGEVSRERVIDTTVCDCCQTDLARTEDGFILVYRNRSANEIRDIYRSHYNTRTGEWSEPAAVSDDEWEISACPVNGPSVVSEGNRAAAAWFTMADDEPSVRFAVSDDGGQTFNEPAELAGENSIGRVDLAAGKDGSYYVSWMEQWEETGYIMMRKVTADSVHVPVQVGITSSSRSSGFPRIAATTQGLLLAWTQTEPFLRVRTAMVPYE